MLTPGGFLLLEHGWQQGEAVRAVFRRSGYSDVETCRDYGGNERVTCGRFSAALPAMLLTILSVLRLRQPVCRSLPGAIAAMRWPPRAGHESCLPSYRCHPCYR